jgi:peptidoglycan/LPS O-acetylase OafA/YrhL
MLLGTPDQALLPALVLTVLVVPVAALTYRFVEKPAMDAARDLIAPSRSAKIAVADTKASAGMITTTVAGGYRG